MASQQSIGEHVTLKILQGASVALVAALSAGCSSSDDSKTGGTNGSSVGTMACNINTGFPGDDLCILPPPSDKGMQLHYGPSSYDDPAEVAKYVLQPGQEFTDCVFMTTPNTTDIVFAEYHSRMRPGSHHQLIYLLGPTSRADSTAPESCYGGNIAAGINQRNLFGAQSEKLDVTNGESKAPENAGLYIKVPASQQAVVQAHFINATDKPILREVWANIVYGDIADVKIYGDPIFFIGGYGMQIPAGQNWIIKGSASVPAAAGPDGVRLVIGTGHFHAHTTRFSAWKTIDGVRAPLFDDYNWHEPSLMIFDSVKKNPAPDPVAGTAGGFSGEVQLKGTDTIDWECEVHNTTDQPSDPAGAPTTLTFENAVYKAEMCNIFGVYAPTIGNAWSAPNVCGPTNCYQIQ